MKIEVHYRACYEYESVVSLSPHIARIFPRQDLATRIEKAVFSAGGGAEIRFRRDAFDNVIACCAFPEPSRTLNLSLDLDLEVESRNPFHFLLDAHALNLPFDYRPDQKTVLDAYRCIEAGLEVPPEIRPTQQPQPTVQRLVTLTRWVFENFRYERRATGAARPASETLVRGSGSCRDLAVLFMEILQAHGLAARLVSGFLWEGGTPQADRRADGAFHAWVDAYLPGAGWVGMDPTNGVFCDHFFIPTAVGRKPQDISPVDGLYYSKYPVPSTLETSLIIQPAEAVA